MTRPEIAFAAFAAAAAAAAVLVAIVVPVAAQNPDCDSEAVQCLTEFSDCSSLYFDGALCSATVRLPFYFSPLCLFAIVAVPTLWVSFQPDDQLNQPTNHPTNQDDGTCYLAYMRCLLGHCKAASETFLSAQRECQLRCPSDQAVCDTGAATLPSWLTLVAVTGLAVLAAALQLTPW